MDRHKHYTFLLNAELQLLMLINQQENPLILETKHFCSSARTQGSDSNHREPGGVFFLSMLDT